VLTPAENTAIRDALKKSHRPFFLFDDDPDGLCSYLLLRTLNPNGVGMPLKSAPNVTAVFAQHVERANSDAVFILDIPQVEKEFVESVKVPVFWIDHHPLQDAAGASYFNPRNHGTNIPTTVMSYHVTENPALIWIAAIGGIADWHWPSFVDLYREQYPDLLPIPVQSPPEALFTTNTGTLARIFSFALKGLSKEVRQNIDCLTKIASPHELLNQTTPAARFLWRHYRHVLAQYHTLKERALRAPVSDGLLVFIYEADELSLTSDLANELQYRIPGVTILLARKKLEEYCCSMRSPHINLMEVFQKAVQGIKGSGGGHDHAIGCAISEYDWERFLVQLKEELRNAVVEIPQGS